MTRFLHKSKCFCYLLIVSLLVPTVASSSTPSADPIKVVNVRFEIVGTKIVVHYDLEGPLDVPEAPAEHDMAYRTHFERRVRLHDRPVYRAEFRKRPSDEVRRPSGRAQSPAH